MLQKNLLRFLFFISIPLLIIVLLSRCHDDKPIENKTVVTPPKDSRYCISYTVSGGTKFFFYKNDLSKITYSAFLDLRAFHGFTVPGELISDNGGNAIQITPDGKTAYFLLYHQDENLGCPGEEVDPDTSYWLAMYRYDFQTKKIDSLFGLPPSDRLLWQLYDSGREIIYCDTTRVLKYYDIATGKTANLAKVNGAIKTTRYFFDSRAKMTIEGDMVNIYYQEDSLLRRFQYSFSTRKVMDEALTLVYTGDWSTEGNRVFVFDLRHNKDGNATARLTGPEGIIEKYISYNNVGTFWHRDTLYVMAENELDMYNAKLELLKKKPLAGSHIYTLLDRGLFVSYMKNKIEYYGLLSFDFKSFTPVDLPAHNPDFNFIGNY